MSNRGQVSNRGQSPDGQYCPSGDCPRLDTNALDGREEQCEIRLRIAETRAVGAQVGTERAVVVAVLLQAGP